MADVTATEKTYNSMTLKVIDLDPNWDNQTDGGRRIDFYFMEENGSEYIEVASKKLQHPKDESGDVITNTESIEYTITGLKSSMTYQIKLEIFKTGSGSEFLAELYGVATTYPKAPNINILEVSGEQMRFRLYQSAFDSSGNVIRGNIYGFNIVITGNDGSYIDFGDKKVTEEINNFDGGINYAQAYTLNYDRYSIAPNTTYTIRVYALKELDDGSIYFNTDYYSEISFVTPKEAELKKFFWSDYGSIPESGDEISNISHTAWNELIDCIKSMITSTGNDSYIPDNESIYGGASGLKYSAAAEYARIYDSDKTLYAYKFNIVNYIIQNISGYITWIDEIQSKEDCYASYLTALQDNYNKNL